MDSPPLFTIPFLASQWDQEYEEFCESGMDEELYGRLESWAGRDKLKETSSEAAFIQHFFRDTWGYTLQADNPTGEFHCYPQFSVARAGQSGGTGSADMALGIFGSEHGAAGLPQVMCEFKDIHSGLDQKQNRKGNNRSPVRQCLDYIREAQAELTGNELVEPSWGIVTDMNEFRLYCRTEGMGECQRFVIESTPGDDITSLLQESESAAFLRFLFWKMFQPSCLISERGPSYLKKLLKDQLVHEEKLENEFYLEYKAYREFLYETIVEANPDFGGTKGRLVRLTQRLLDRCLFLLFCEDMGESLSFPSHLLRDVLISYSKDPYYDEEDTILWERIKTLFQAMNKGGDFGDSEINEFDGGLFREFPELEQLTIPSKVFCAKNQGAGGREKLLEYPETLLYFSAKYNFGIKGPGHERVIDFYALGRIFEQSITELEIMEAEAEGRPSLNLLSKRKRDGVYYTPEWVTEYIVEETVGAYLRDCKEELELTDEHRPDDDEVKQYRRFLEDRRRSAPVGGAWRKSLDEYGNVLRRLKVVDPACGSGAFLVQTLRFLKQEHRWIAEERQRLTGETELWDTDAVIRSILANNIYGVDTNAESVEITKLALWMHTARPGQKLSALDDNIRCGNSLVAPDFYGDRQEDLFSDEEREQINVFDWEESFSEVFDRGGFDCVIGNPPYVKLQHFRKVKSEVAEYLTGKSAADGKVRYESTQTGSFDMYLPFIEKGLELLQPEGRMGYIAPSVWIKNQYGKGLRNRLKETQQLDRWLDFQSFQVFDDVTTYTAIQLFTAKDNAEIRCFEAPSGKSDIAGFDWSKAQEGVSYAELPADNEWLLVPNRIKRFMSRLASQNPPLGSMVESISQGLISGAFWIYANQRIAPGVYLHNPRSSVKDSPPYEIGLEESITLTLASGGDIKRYQTVRTDLEIIYPYTKDGDARLLEPSKMKTEYPKAWEYLKGYEEFLRQRDGGKLDDDCWYRYSRNQNLTKQSRPKVMIAGTAKKVICAVDEGGEVAANDKRVYSIFSKNREDLWYLAAILNSPVASFYFKRIARPKANGYFDIEKQFLAPLPVPEASESEKEQVGDLARKLQELHTDRRDLVGNFDNRLNSDQTVKDYRRDTWLWADIGSVSDWKKSDDAPDNLDKKALSAWAKEKKQAVRQAHYEELDARLHEGANLTVEDEPGEIRLKIDDCVVIRHYDDPQTPFIAGQWRHAVRDLNVTEKFTAKRLVRKLLHLRSTEDATLRERLIEIDSEITSLDTRIVQKEAEMNDKVYGLYGLSDDEVQLIEDD